MNYPANLCSLSNEEQAAIEEDKALWFECYKAVKELSVSEIKLQLEKIDCEITKVDIQRRLNACYVNNKRFTK